MRKINNFTQILFRHFGHDLKNPKSYRGKSTIGCGAVISIGHSLDASVLATIWAKEQGIGQVIAKAYDEKQGKILTKIGADKIVYPEKEIGIQLANDLAFSNMFDTRGR